LKRKRTMRSKTSSYSGFKPQLLLTVYLVAAFTCAALPATCSHYSYAKYSGKALRAEERALRAYHS
jgi:hypothetical protein